MRAPDPVNTSEQQALLLRLLREHSALTRRQLAELSGYSISLVRQLTESLAQYGLISGDRMQPVDVPGRPSQLWSISPDACLAIGLDMSSRAVRIVILNANGQIIFQKELPRHETSTADELLEYMVMVVNDALSVLEDRRTLVHGLGVAFGGFVDFKRGVSLDAIDIAHAKLLPLQHHLERRLSLPVVLDDRSRAMALAEVRIGAARSQRDCICVNVSGGIGTGIIIDGALYRGALGLAGELGHIPVIAGGSPCRCGGHGCLETVASGTAIETRARMLLSQGIETSLYRYCTDPTSVTVAMIVQAARDGDAVALSLLEHAGQWLGFGLATLVNLYSCAHVVMTGSVMRENDLLLEIIRREALRYIIRPMRDHVHMKLTALDLFASAVGAATFVLDAEFERGFAERLARLEQS
jgi:predicted NBD/HSP70 family sugar kinase